MWKYTDETNTAATDGELVVETNSEQWFSLGLDVKAESGEILAHDYVEPVEPEPEHTPEPIYDMCFTSASNYSVKLIESGALVMPYQKAWEIYRVQWHIDNGLVKAFDWDVEPVEPEPEPTLEELKSDKVNQINAWRDSEEAKTPNFVEVDGVKWDSDPASRNRIQSALTGTVEISFWTDFDNVDRVDFDLQLIHNAIIEQGFAIHERQRTMKQDVEAITTAEELETYAIGWPY